MWHFINSTSLDQDLIFRVFRSLNSPQDNAQNVETTFDLLVVSTVASRTSVLHFELSRTFLCCHTRGIPRWQDRGVGGTSPTGSVWTKTDWAQKNDWRHDR